MHRWNIPAPGTERALAHFDEPLRGPCAVDCDHSQCASDRVIAEATCPVCLEETGYETDLVLVDPLEDKDPSYTVIVGPEVHVCHVLCYYAWIDPLP